MLDDLLRQADYVSINCPHTAETRGMIGAREFALMQPHAYFITTARGGIHDEAALAEALRANQIAGAGLDVWEDEPPPPPIIRCWRSTTCWSVRTPPASRASRGRTSPASPRSRCWTCWTASARRGC